MPDLTWTSPDSLVPALASALRETLEGTFASLPDATRAELLAAAEVTRLEPGQEVRPIWDSHCWLVVRGVLAMGVPDDDKPRSPRPWLPGSVLGEHRVVFAALAERPAKPVQMLLVALMPTLLVRLPLPLLERHRDETAYLRSAAARFFNEEQVSRRSLVFHTTTDKQVLLARCLVFLADLFGIPILDKLELRIRQEELARFSCLTRRYVNMCLANWAREGWLETSKGAILLVDFEAVLRLADLPDVTTLRGDREGARRLDERPL